MEEIKMNYIDDGISILKPKNDYIFKRIFGDEKNSDIFFRANKVK